MVGGAGNAPVVTSDVCFATPVLQTGSRDTSQIGSGGGSRAHGGRAYEARLNLILPAVKWWSRWVPPPYELACRASALLVCHDPMKIGKPPWCCPRQAEFWRLCCTSWCAAYWIAECTKVRSELCIQRNWCGCRESHPDMRLGTAPFSS